MVFADHSGLSFHNTINLGRNVRSYPFIIGRQDFNRLQYGKFFAVKNHYLHLNIP